MLSAVPFALAALLFAAFAPPLAWADSPGIGVVTTLSGTATVARASLSRPLPLRFKDDVFLEDRISTAEKSTVRVLLGGKALVTVRELSVLTITETPGHSTIDLISGKIAVAVARQRMAPGERIEIHTPNAVAAVRGTVLVMEVIPGSQATTHLSVARGLVDLFRKAPPGGPAMPVGGLQSLSLVGGAPGQLRNLTLDQLQALFADLMSDPQFADTPDDLLDTLVGGEQQRAAALAQFLAYFRTGGASGSGGCAGADCVANNNITPCSGGGTCSGGNGGGGSGGGTTKSGKALTTYNNQNVNVGGDFYSVANKANVALAQPLLETTATKLTVGGSLVDVKGTLAANDAANPFIFLDPTTFTATSLLNESGGGSMTAATTFFKDLLGTQTLTGDAVAVSGNSSLSGTGAAAFLALDGSTMAVTGNVLNATGAKSTVTLAGTLLEETNGATVTAQKLASVNAALLSASAPLLNLSGNSAFISNLDAVDLSGVNAKTTLASLATLNASVFTVKNGAAFKISGGSTVSMGGDLFTLANKSTLNILNGALLNLSGNSALTITGSLLNFVGTGNTVSITNSLCGGPCVLIAGIPVFITGGATVSLTNPVKNAAGNTITYSSTSTALLVVNGAKSTVTVLGK